MAQYANGFSIVASKESGEFIISFTQNQPEFNPESGALDKPASREVATIVMQFALGEQLKESIADVIKKEQEK